MPHDVRIVSGFLPPKVTREAGILRRKHRPGAVQRGTRLPPVVIR